jgi:hypothetical protein
MWPVAGDEEHRRDGENPHTLSGCSHHSVSIPGR